jgi:hypothetical protein
MTAKDDDRAKQDSDSVAGNPACLALEPKLGEIYVIELCSGERRRWRYLGVSEQSPGWWRDMETGLEFSETSLMYAWRIIGAEPPQPNPES